MRLSIVLVPVLGLALGAGAWLALSARSNAPEPSLPSESTGPVLDAAIRTLTRAGKATSAERTALLAEARAGFVAVERSTSSAPAPVFWHGVVEVMAHDEAKASELYARLLPLVQGGARSPAALYLRSIHLLEFDRANAQVAVRRLRALQAEAPEFLPELVMRARYRAHLVVHENETRKGDLSKATEAVRDALAVAADDEALRAPAERTLAYSLGLMGDWLDSERLWERIVADSGGRSAEAVFALAGSRAAQNRFAEAEAGYTAVLALVDAGKVPEAERPAYQEALLRRANCRRLLERFDEAKADLEAFLALYPQDHRAWYWLGVVLNDGFQDPDRAMGIWEKTLAVSPECDNILHAMLGVLRTTRPDAAREKALDARLKDLLASREAAKAGKGKEGEGQTSDPVCE